MSEAKSKSNSRKSESTNSETGNNSICLFCLKENEKDSFKCSVCGNLLQLRSVGEYIPSGPVTLSSKNSFCFNNRPFDSLGAQSRWQSRVALKNSTYAGIFNELTVQLSSEDLKTVNDAISAQQQIHDWLMQSKLRVYHLDDLKGTPVEVAEELLDNALKTKK